MRRPKHPHPEAQHCRRDDEATSDCQAPRALDSLSRARMRLQRLNFRLGRINQELAPDDTELGKGLSRPRSLVGYLIAIQDELDVLEETTAGIERKFDGENTCADEGADDED